jgi:hypothetical protein
MSALAEASAGLALAMSIALLCTERIEAASILLVAQSAAVAVTAAMLHQPLMALPPLLLAGGLLVGGLLTGGRFAGGLSTGGCLGGGVWFARHRTPPPRAPEGSAMRGVVAGAVLAVLCLSHDSLGLPLAIVLLAILLAVTRRHPSLQVIALIAAQNGLVLAGCLVVEPAIFSPVLLPVVCLVLPLPLAAHLMIPPETRPRARAVPWLERIDLALSVAMFASTLIVPLDGLASVFAPLLGFDAVMRSCVRRKRHGLPPPRRIFALLQSSFVLLAVCAPNVLVAWLALVGAMATFLLPWLRTGTRPYSGVVGSFAHVRAVGGHALTSLSGCAPGGVDVGRLPAIAVSPDPLPALTVSRSGAIAATASSHIEPSRTQRWDEAILAFSGAGIVLFGLLMLSSRPSILGYFSVFAGFAAIAAAVPDLAVVLVILLLRLANQAQWPPAVEALGSGIALIGLLACARRVSDSAGSHRATLLQLGQCGIAALAVCVGQADGRFAALVLLVLLILTRSAARVTGGFASTLAMAGLGGVPPLGVFPGLVLVVIAISNQEPWVLLPLGATLISLFLASIPRRRIAFPLRPAIPSPGLLPLVLALLVGYCTPDGLVLWWHMLTAGHS